MNMFKKNGGFTLVELIVVIAILAILAGVAVPAYSGYIAKASQAADMAQLDSMKTAIVFAAMEEKAEAKVTGATVTFGNLKSVTITGTNLKDTSVDISEFFGDSYTPSTTGKTGATWDGVKWTLTPDT